MGSGENAGEGAGDGGDKKKKYLYILGYARPSLQHSGFAACGIFSCGVWVGSLPGDGTLASCIGTLES